MGISQINSSNNNTMIRYAVIIALFLAYAKSCLVKQTPRLCHTCTACNTGATTCQFCPTCSCSMATCPTNVGGGINCNQCNTAQRITTCLCSGIAPTGGKKKRSAEGPECTALRPYEEMAFQYCPHKAEIHVA